jgi:acyl-CoA thioesterase-1
MVASLSHIIYFCSSGLAFFVGVGLVLLAILINIQQRWPRLHRLTFLLTFLGIACVCISATPLPYWIYAVLAVVTLLWLIAEHWRAKLTPVRLKFIRIGVIAAWLAAVALECPYHLEPTVSNCGTAELWVVADSVTAGVGDKTETWPRIMERQRGVTVHDLSMEGATLASAIRTLERNALGKGVILLEIGGNDMLGSTSDADFEERLERLLTMVCQPGRTVIMIELPLPPLRNALGITQRKLAASHAVTLVPRRFFVDILTTSGATIDGIHLTPSGQEQMEAMIWRMVAPALGK